VSRQPYFVSPVTVDEQGRKTVHGYAKAVDLETLEPDSDIYAVTVDRVVSISPMTIDLTASVDMPRLQRLLTLADESRV
jgi:broad specificity polyphosphatase/5'/3'-nucleotidase SurE